MISISQTKTGSMRKVDIHHHLVQEAGYVDQLLATMDRHGIERTGLIGLGELFAGLFVQGDPAGTAPDNAAVQAAVRAHPDRFFGLGFIRLGADSPATVDELAERGFRGLKFHAPRGPYDDERFLPVFARAAHHGLPCLFHTGILALPAARPGEGVRSAYMDPIHLEGLAQEFPQLVIIIAHLGVQSAMTAATMIRIFPNIYADLTGSIPGWRMHYGPEDWRRLLCWPDAPQKILFGTDVHCSETSDAISLQQEIFDALGWTGEEQQDIYHRTARRLFKFS